MDASRPMQQNATLRRFMIEAEYQGRLVAIVKGAAYDYGDGACRHSVICEAVHDLVNGVTYAGGMGSISGLKFEPLPPPKSKGRPAKTERNIALALAYTWLTGFFVTERNLPIRAARARAYGELVEMWGEKFWQGAPNESAARKNIKKGMADIKKGMAEIGEGLLRLNCWTSDPTDGYVVLGKKEDFDIEPHKRMRFEGVCWVWRYGEQHAVYGKASIPETSFLES